jgi:hypothetical protein
MATTANGQTRVSITILERRSIIGFVHWGVLPGFLIMTAMILKGSNTWVSLNSEIMSSIIAYSKRQHSSFIVEQCCHPTGAE